FVGSGICIRDHPPPPNLNKKLSIQKNFLANIFSRILHLSLYNVCNKILHFSLFSIVSYLQKRTKSYQRNYFKKHEKETFFLKHFYLTSVYIGTTAGYYLAPKGAKTFIDATERFKIIEPVDMFMDNPTYHDVANLTYVPCALSLNEHSLDSNICNQNLSKLSECIALPKPPKKSYFKNLFYYSLNARKRLKTFKNFYKKYNYLQSN
uniref:glycosyltransferase family 25 protein n=1 Tax=Helicobacter cetorum TaxID=138563 RepID=UPI0018F83408